MTITAELAIKELKRRHRDPITGKKTGTHKNGHTDARYSTTPEARKLGTKELLEIASQVDTQVPAPVEPTHVQTPEMKIPAGYEVEWVDDIPVLVAA